MDQSEDEIKLQLHSMATRLASIMDAVAVSSAVATASNGCDDQEKKEQEDAFKLPPGLDSLVADVLVMVEKLTSQNSELSTQLSAASHAKEELESELSSIQGRLRSTEDKVNSTLDVTATMENSLFEKNEEVSALRKEIRALSKEKEDLIAKLESESLSVSKLREEWLAKEAQLSESIKNLKKMNDDLKSQSKEQKETEASISSDHSMVVEELKKEIKDRDERLVKAVEKITLLHTTSTDQSQKIDTLLKQFTRLKEELAEVQEQNQMLMEENESFQLLLEEKTLSGEILESDVVQGNKRKSLAAVGQSLFDELQKNDTSTTSEAAKQAANALMEENQLLHQQLDAVNMYLEKIHKRVFTEEAMEAALSESNVNRKVWPFRDPYTRTTPHSSAARTAASLRQNHSTTSGAAAPLTPGGSPGRAPRTSSLTRTGGRKPAPPPKLNVVVIADEHGTVIHNPSAAELSARPKEVMAEKPPMTPLAETVQYLGKGIQGIQSFLGFGSTLAPSSAAAVPPPSVTALPAEEKNE